MYPGVYDYIKQRYPNAGYSRVYYQSNSPGTLIAQKSWTQQGAKHILLHSIQWTLPIGVPANTVEAKFLYNTNIVILDQVNVSAFNQVNYLPLLIEDSSELNINCITAGAVSFTVGYQYITLPLLEL